MPHAVIRGADGRVRDSFRIRLDKHWNVMSDAERQEALDAVKQIGADRAVERGEPPLNKEQGDELRYQLEYGID